MHPECPSYLVWVFFRRILLAIWYQIFHFAEKNMCLHKSDIFSLEMERRKTAIIRLSTSSHLTTLKEHKLEKLPLWFASTSRNSWHKLYQQNPIFLLFQRSLKIFDATALHWIKRKVFWISNQIDCVSKLSCIVQFQKIFIIPCNLDFNLTWKEINIYVKIQSSSIWIDAPRDRNNFQVGHEQIWRSVNHFVSFSPFALEQSWRTEFRKKSSTNLD